MKRKALAIILIAAVVALSIGTWVIYSRISEFQDQSMSVKITEFEWESGFNPIVGLTLGNRVNVTIENSGAKDVSGLALSVRLVRNGTELSEGFTKQIDTLRAGESMEISDTLLYSLDSTSNPAECVSTLMWGNVALDEQTKVIVWG